MDCRFVIDLNGSEAKERAKRGSDGELRASANGYEEKRRKKGLRNRKKRWQFKRDEI